MLESQTTKLYTNHSNGTAHGGTADIIKYNIKYHVMGNYAKGHVQATIITIGEKNICI